MGEVIDYGGRKTASLKPSSMTAEDEVGIGGSGLPALEVGIRNHWEPDGVLKSDKIESCLLIVKWNLEHLGHRLNTSAAEVARFALHIGIRRLWSLPGIDELKDIRSFVHENSEDADDRRWFDQGAFDLGSSDTTTLHTRLYENDVVQCSGLASALGLRGPLVRQLAIMAGLIQSQNIPVKQNNQMVDILRRFREWIEDRLEKAQRRKKEVEAGADVRPRLVGPKKTWDDVVE